MLHGEIKLHVRGRASILWLLLETMVSWQGVLRVKVIEEVEGVFLYKKQLYGTFVLYPVALPWSWIVHKYIYFSKA